MLPVARPCSDKVASLAVQWDAALLPSSIIKYIGSLDLSGITLSLVRRIYQEGPHISVSRGLPPPLVQTQLFHNESKSVRILGHLLRHPWNMTASTAQSMEVYSTSLGSETRVFHWTSSSEGSLLRSCSKKKKHFSLARCIKNKQLSVCVLSEQRRSPSTTVTTGPWSFRGVCKNTHSSSSQAKTPVRSLFVAVFVFM